MFYQPLIALYLVLRTPSTNGKGEHISRNVTKRTVLHVCLTHLCRVDTSTWTLWTGSISSRRGVWLFFVLFPCFIEIPVFNANSEGPDQTPRSAASDLDLHCLPMSLLRDAQQRFRSACAFAQSARNLCWAHMSEYTFSDVATRIVFGRDPISVVIGVGLIYARSLLNQVVV